jgi:predicted glycoside hydrolase/deacetylase ChbG (UPF0249 family)
MARVGFTPSSRKLIINADDYGLSRGVNTGIIEAAERGSVTSASMIVNLPRFDESVASARSCPALSLGLAAQIDRMVEVGIRPSHLDSHRHVHAHPSLWPAVLEAASSRGVSNVRVPTEPMWANVRDWKATMKKTGLLMSSRIARRRVEHNTAVHFFGLSLQGGSTFAARLFALIPRLPAGTTELMTHPGYADAELSEHDGYTWQREEELRVLCSKELRDLLLRHGIELVTFRNLTPRAASDGKVAQHR